MDQWQSGVYFSATYNTAILRNTSLPVNKMPATEKKSRRGSRLIWSLVLVVKARVSFSPTVTSCHHHNFPSSPSPSSSPVLSSTMAPSSSLQIPAADSAAGPSRHNAAASRPVSVNVHSATTPAPAAASSRRQRASHTVVSSTHEQPRQNGKERSQDGQTPYTDVYSHPAAVAYAAAHPKRTIPKFGPYLLLQTLGEGEFGKVKLGLHSQWGEEVAVKLIRRGNIDSAVRMSKVEREIEVLRVRPLHSCSFLLTMLTDFVDLRR